MVTLINQLASMSGATAALQAQAENANQVAKKCKEDKELLEQVGSTLVGPKFKRITFVRYNHNCKIYVRQLIIE